MPAVRSSHAWAIMPGVNDEAFMCCKIMPSGKTLKVSHEAESWGSFKINGKTVRYKTIVLEARKVRGGGYAYRTTTVFDHGRPAVNATRDSETA